MRQAAGSSAAWQAPSEPVDRVRVAGRGCSSESAAWEPRARPALNWADNPPH